MKAKRNVAVCSLIAALAVSQSLADTFLWDGGGGDNNWSTGANWNPDGSPVSAADTLIQFNGATRLTPVQDIAPTSQLNRVEFLGGASFMSAFTLSGNPLHFVANGAMQPSIYLARYATCVIANDIHVPAATTLSLDISTYAVDLRGLITGKGALDKTSISGGLSLFHADNTFSGGLAIHANNSDWAKFNVYASNAMGTGPVSLYGGALATGLTNPGGLLFYNTTSHTNDIILFQNSPIFASIPNAIGDVTLNGNIDLNTYTLYLRGGGVGTVNGVISEGAANAITKVDAGTWTLAGTNTFTGRLTINNGAIKLGVAGTLRSTHTSAFRFRALRAGPLS